MSETVQNPEPQPKKRGRCCLSCGLIFLALTVLLLGVYFLLPVVKRELNEYWDDLKAGRLQKTQ
mgnify:CR=1 FL=1